MPVRGGWPEGIVGGGASWWHRPNSCRQLQLQNISKSDIVFPVFLSIVVVVVVVLPNCTRFSLAQKKSDEKQNKNSYKNSYKILSLRHVLARKKLKKHK